MGQTSKARSRTGKARRRLSRRVLSTAGMVAAIASGVPSGRVVAQQAIQLDEITVTARKRPESEKNVPISLTTVEGAQLDDLSKTRSNADLARTVPNVNFVDLGGQSSNLANIRGVGSFSPVS